MIVGIQNEILKIHSLGLLKRLLEDKTTRANIIWATDAYKDRGIKFERDQEIKIELVTGSNSDVIKNRAIKEMEHQAERTRQHAEVFTPLWICKMMNECTDDGWFDLNNPHPFNKVEKIEFQATKTWKKYVDSRLLEITCGEVPYLVSRYDVSNGESIPVSERIGILDRKLRIVNENTELEDEWLEWATRAFQSTYGYEFQGDNLLIARVNLLMTFEEYMEDKWKRKPSLKEYQSIANIISWNIWQMDGLTDTIPYCKAEEEIHQITMFEFFNMDIADETKRDEQPLCEIYNWRSGHRFKFRTMKERSTGTMKFDFIIGNPPYQDETTTNNRAGALYPFFYDAAKKLADKYMLISPARFLFNAGLTSKTWNQMMLNDPNLKVVYYNKNSAEVFSNTDIKGGVAIVYRDSETDFGAIKEFIPNDILRRIADKFKNNEQSMTDIMFGGRSDLKFNEEFLLRYPESVTDRLKAIQVKHPTVEKLGPNEEYELKSSTFDVLYYVFTEEEPKVSEESYYKILGLVEGKKRTYRWIERKYMTPRYPENNNIDKYKVFIPKASGSGQFGETLSVPVIASPGVSSTPTFISIGKFESLLEAENAAKYIRTKFARALLGVLKITQDIVPSKWRYVPAQIFGEKSDIDWTRSIQKIDAQLYKKYCRTTRSMRKKKKRREVAGSLIAIGIYSDYFSEVKFEKKFRKDLICDKRNEKYCPRLEGV